MNVLANAAKIDAESAIVGLSLVIAGYLVSVWLCHDYLLEKKGLELFELLILATLVVGIAFFFNSILLISISFVALNVIRTVRDHRQLKLQHEA